jgi:tRNA-dihydrouridine synthase B
MLAIGTITLSPPLVLAPLSGVSDLPFRLMNRRHGCGLAFTEMISTQAVIRNVPKTMKMLDTTPEDRPLGVQLLGNDENSIRRTLEVLDMKRFAVVDLNAACPVKKVVRRGEGAALMLEPGKLASLLRFMVEHSPVPVTVKIRSGWDATSVNAAEVARHAEDAGVSALFIHGRTRAQGYRGTTDYAIIKAVKDAVGIPVVGSGDVLSPELGRKMLGETGCDGLVLARGAMGNPWMFPRMAEYLRNGTIVRGPDTEERTAAMHEHFSLCCTYYGPEKALKIFRKFYIWYSRGMRDVRVLREEAMHANTPGDMIGAIHRLREAGLGAVPG